MATIKSNLKKEIKNAYQRGGQLKEQLKHLNLLPQELAERDWGDLISPTFYNLSEDYEICLRLYKQSQLLVDELKGWLGETFGFSFEKVGHSSGNTFYYSGIIEGIEINGKNVRIQIDNAPKPTGCRLVEKKVTREVIEYEAYCEDTNEKL